VTEIKKLFYFSCRKQKAKDFVGMFGVVTGGDSNRGEYIGKSTFE
jgi:hypothetical protein